MNNATIIIKKSKDDIDDFMGLESDEASLAQTIRSLEYLKANVHFKRYYLKVIIPRLQKKEAKIAKEKDLIEIYRLQGAIEELKEMATEKIELLTKNYKAKIQHIWQKKN